MRSTEEQNWKKFSSVYFWAGLLEHVTRAASQAHAERADCWPPAPAASLSWRLLSTALPVPLTSAEAKDSFSLYVKVVAQQLKTAFWEATCRKHWLFGVGLVTLGISRVALPVGSQWEFILNTHLLSLSFNKKKRPSFAYFLLENGNICYCVFRLCYSWTIYI